MKTSNLILLLLAVVPVLFVAAIPVTFHWKLTHGDAIFVNPKDNFEYNQSKFTKVKSIVLSNIDCEILPSDSIKIDVERTHSDLLNMTQHNDTLMISLNQTGSSPRIRLYLPSMDKITATNSKILLRGQLRTTDRRSYTFHINNTSLRTGNVSDEERISQFFDSIFIAGSNSLIDLSGTLHITRLSITDIENVIRSPRVSIEEIIFVYNDKSKVMSTGKDGTMRIVAE